MQSQPAGSIDDAIETFIAASEQTLVKVDIDQETGQALAQLEMPATYECGKMDFSTLGYKGINYIFSRFKVKDKNESKHHSLVIAKRPDAATNAGNPTRLGRKTTALVMVLMAAMIINKPIAYGLIAGIMCHHMPDYCYDLYAFIHTMLADSPHQKDQSTQTDIH